MHGVPDVAALAFRLAQIEHSVPEVVSEHKLINMDKKYAQGAALAEVEAWKKRVPNYVIFEPVHSRLAADVDAVDVAEDSSTFVVRGGPCVALVILCLCGTRRLPVLTAPCTWPFPPPQKKKSNHPIPHPFPFTLW